MTQQPLLTVENLQAGYGETEVLRGIDMDVASGEVVALIGRNGVGKTTTLRSITGAVSPTGGTVDFAGDDITGLSPVAVARQGIALVPEERRVFPGLTVRENLTIGQLGDTTSIRRHDVEDVLEMFENLRERQHSRGTDLSGGEQQMLAIARALVCGADLLMLDEPTEGLAPYVVRRVEELVRDLNTEEMTVLLVEQNVAVAMELADRVYILDDGVIVWKGTSDELSEDKAVLDRHLGVTM